MKIDLLDNYTPIFCNKCGKLSIAYECGVKGTNEVSARILSGGQQNCAKCTYCFLTFMQCDNNYYFSIQSARNIYHLSRKCHFSDGSTIELRILFKSFGHEIKKYFITKNQFSVQFLTSRFALFCAYQFRKPLKLLINHVYYLIISFFFMTLLLITVEFGYSELKKCIKVGSHHNKILCLLLFHLKVVKYI